ncbi:leucine-rich repeat protein soc-2 [Dorcoceras hygrometricum]|uniref:Leucine-rich repeat protein soc-2 n=1 Tax=Dorcoceras hygrometricum TaxID=472368 RepID=A0A2Z7DAM2_9LAMI|nr:leucine-rich repeat protein soc-2 [Dorcoceras hygrometricum]
MCVSIWELPTRLSTRYQVHKQRSTCCCPTHEMWELPTPLTVANSLTREMRDGSYPCTSTSTLVLVGFGPAFGRCAWHRHRIFLIVRISRWKDISGFSRNQPLSDRGCEGERQYRTLISLLVWCKDERVIPVCLYTHQWTLTILRRIFVNC